MDDLQDELGPMRNKTRAHQAQCLKRPGHVSGRLCGQQWLHEPWPEAGQHHAELIRRLQNL